MLREKDGAPFDALLHDQDQREHEDNCKRGRKYRAEGQGVQAEGLEDREVGCEALEAMWYSDSDSEAEA